MKLFFKRLFGGNKPEPEQQANDVVVNSAPVFAEHLTLYYSVSCPYCIRVQMAMARFGLTIKRRNIHQDDVARMQLLKGGGRTTVPCLRIDNEGEASWMYESRDIIRYLQGVVEVAGTD
tara:strand:+ start:1832 stop:2188 length:357 start_codon:yes stop_codon:yes gene_type:complete